MINDTSSFIDHLYCCYFFICTYKKKNLRQVKEDMVPTLSLSLSFSFSDVLFRLLYTYVHTHERGKENDEAKQFDVYVCVYVCARSLQFKPDGVYVLFFSLILVRANINRRRLSAMYKPFIILAPVQQQLNAFFFSFLFLY